MGRYRRTVHKAASPAARLAGQLRALRADAGLGAPTIDQIAAQSGVSRSTLHTALNGTRIPSVATLRALVRAWGGDEAEWAARRDAAVNEAAASSGRTVAEEPSWDSVLARAGELAPLSLGGPSGAETWDLKATRGIIAIDLYIAARASQVAPAQVPLGDLLPPLMTTPEVFAVHTATTLTACGHELVEDARRDPVAAQWDWLVKEWDPHAPAGYRWDGLSRGIARGTRRPAIEVCLGWAAAAVSAALAAERGAWASRTRVRVTGGRFGGEVLCLEHPVWQRTPAGTSIVPGPPTEYTVNLGEKHGFRCEAIATTHLQPVQ
ncbi:helix-turn-helix transcriptional regulator [Amycolatopsis sp. NPDC004079]|uniref:helix-turn-helix domain-containing protein n=1 Tax=Amycolatopsis sp. NPDC004079 TaxID=3154549 RepID=UPI0033B64F30